MARFICGVPLRYGKERAEPCLTPGQRSLADCNAPASTLRLCQGGTDVQRGRQPAVKQYFRSSSGTICDLHRLIALSTVKGLVHTVPPCLHIGMSGEHFQRGIECLLTQGKVMRSARPADNIADWNNSAHFLTSPIVTSGSSQPSVCHGLRQRTLPDASYKPDVVKLALAAAGDQGCL